MCKTGKCGRCRVCAQDAERRRHAAFRKVARRLLKRTRAPKGWGL